MTSHCLSGCVPNHQSKEVVLPPEPRGNITLYTKEQLHHSQYSFIRNKTSKSNFQKFSWTSEHFTFPNMLPVLVFSLPAGHWVQSTAAEGCFASACEKTQRASLPASSDQLGDFRLPGFHSCVELPSKSKPRFSRCNIFSRWPATYGDTELKRQDLSSEDTCAPVCCPDLFTTCFGTGVETLLHSYIKVFEDCRHHSFDSEARSRVEASHCVLGLDLRWANIDVCDSLRVSVT